MTQRFLERCAVPMGILGVTLIIAGLVYGESLGLGLGALGLGLLLLIAYSPGDGLLLLGPFARWELVRTAKRGWMFWYRVVVCVVVLLLIGGQFQLIETVFMGFQGMTAPNAHAQAAEYSVQIILGLIGFLAGAFSLVQLPTIITEEKESKRIEHVLVTDLRNREIIVGKLVGRFSVLLSYIACVFPILAILMLFGGVDPLILLTTAFLLAIVFVGVGGVAAGASAFSEKSTSAVVLTLAVVFGHQIICSNIQSFELPRWMSRVTDFLEYGNLTKVTTTIQSATGSNAQLSMALRYCAANQLLLASVGWLVAVLLIRRDGRSDGGSAVRKLRSAARAPAARGPMFDLPIVWLETTAPGSILTRWANRWLVGYWWLIAVPIAMLTGLGCLDNESTTQNNSTTATLHYFSGVYTWFFICLPAAWSASRNLVRERQHDTLQALLLTDLEPCEILRQKWIAAVMVGRSRWVVALAFWFTGVVMGAISIASVVMVILSTAATTAMMTSLGLFSSVVSKTMQSAFGKVLLGWFGWMIALYFLMCCGAGVVRWSGGPYAGGMSLAILGALMPPTPMVVASFIIETGRDESIAVGVGCVLLGIIVSVVVAKIAFTLALDRFQRQTRPRPRKREPIRD